MVHCLWNKVVLIKEQRVYFFRVTVNNTEQRAQILHTRKSSIRACNPLLVCMRRAALKQKNSVTYLWGWSKIAGCRGTQLGSDWRFDSSAAKNSMKYFPQIWNVVSFTWQQFIVTVHTGTLAVGDWAYIWFYSIPTQRVQAVFLALSRL